MLGHPAFSSDPSQPGYPDVQPDQPPQPPGFFANVDAPVHTTMRRTLTREFMVKKIDALRPTITGITGQLLDEIARSQGPADLVERFALPLPSHPAERGDSAVTDWPGTALSGGGPDAPNPWGRDRREVPGPAVDLPPVRRRIRGRHRAL